MNFACAAIFLAMASGLLYTTADAMAQETDKREIATGISVLDRIICPYEDGMEKDVKVRIDSISESDKATRYTGLTEEDFIKVAEELGVETAAIKAVVAIEAGVAMKGFWAPGVPVINFDKRMYSRFKAKATSKNPAKGEEVPEGLTGYALKEWTQLINARKINARCADMGTFWGMFQIGGFNYHKCGCETIEEFVRLMSYSELEQLELFATFITNGGMLGDLRNKNWAGFARKYNGPGYARRGYHTKMAAAYKKYKAAENQKDNKK
ncbi:MAG: N-acetylmuramidase family protein [Muribaculaceae bacterium]|nr:N-acetylmuramidase family protein [Muribaculaceae bacterium]